MKIENSIVFISGANRGLGLAFAQEALKRGAKNVYAGVRNPTSTNPPGIVQVKLDVTDAASIAAAAKKCGDTTLLVNNAGIARLNNVLCWAYWASARKSPSGAPLSATSRPCLRGSARPGRR